MAPRLTSLDFPSDPPNEAAWGRLISRVRGKQKVCPTGLESISLNLPFNQMEAFEIWVNTNSVHVAEIGPKDGFSVFVVHGQGPDLIYAKLLWGGK